MCISRSLGPQRVSLSSPEPDLEERPSGIWLGHAKQSKRATVIDVIWVPLRLQRKNKTTTMQNTSANSVGFRTQVIYIEIIRELWICRTALHVFLETRAAARPGSFRWDMKFIILAELAATWWRMVKPYTQWSTLWWQQTHLKYNKSWGQISFA